MQNTLAVLVSKKILITTIAVLGPILLVFYLVKTDRYEKNPRPIRQILPTTDHILAHDQVAASPRRPFSIL